MRRCDIDDIDIGILDELLVAAMTGYGVRFAFGDLVSELLCFLERAAGGNGLHYVCHIVDITCCRVLEKVSGEKVGNAASNHDAPTQGKLISLSHCVQELVIRTLVKATQVNRVEQMIKCSSSRLTSRLSIYTVTFPHGVTIPRSILPQDMETPRTAALLQLCVDTTFPIQKNRPTTFSAAPHISEVTPGIYLDPDSHDLLRPCSSRHSPFVV
jgi:hypothetical protein